MSIPSILDPSRLEGIELSNDEVARYSRHLIMPEVTLDGQKKLKAAKRDVKYVELGGDDHWLSSASTRTQMLQEIETFLAQHLRTSP